MKPKIYEKYPLWMVFVYNIVMLSVYLAGAYILFKFNLIIGILYLVYLIILESGVYREGCRYCYYYGKRCVAGKGLIAPIFVKKGNPKKFCARKLEWKDFILQILVVLVPIVTGAIILISDGFDFLILTAMIYPLFSWFFLNPIVYGKLACPHCKQGKICCPALNFFTKKK